MHYLRPKEEDILVEYQKAVALLTIDSDAILLNKQIQELEDKNQNNEWIIKGKLQEQDEEIKQLKLMHETDIGQIRQEMQSKFHELITKIDLVNIQ